MYLSSACSQHCASFRRPGKIGQDHQSNDGDHHLRCKPPARRLGFFVHLLTCMILANCGEIPILLRPYIAAHIKSGMQIGKDDIRLKLG